MCSGIITLEATQKLSESLLWLLRYALAPVCLLHK
ncbi:hypothetical protein [Enterococcus phage PEF7b]